MGSVIKSVRIDEELLRAIGDDANFSSLANKAIKEHLNKTVWVPNFEIQNHAGITPTLLLKRVKSVKYLRYSSTAISFTLYPTSKTEIERNKNIHAYAQGNFNSIHDTWVYFNIKFPRNFLFFLQSKPWSDVNRCIVGFLSLLYWLEKDSRHLFKDQLERDVLKAVIKNNSSSLIKNLSTTHRAYQNKPNAISRSKYNVEFFNAITALGIDPIMFPYMSSILRHIHYPIHFSDVLAFENGRFEIKLAAGYMRNLYENTDDWPSIVVNGTDQTDDLKRAESLAEPWENWLQEYSFLHSLELTR